MYITKCFIIDITMQIFFFFWTSMQLHSACYPIWHQEILHIYYSEIKIWKVIILSVWFLILISRLSLSLHNTFWSFLLNLAYIQWKFSLKLVSDENRLNEKKTNEQWKDKIVKFKKKEKSQWEFNWYYS